MPGTIQKIKLLKLYELLQRETDKNHQRKGYGRAAMQQALELVRSFPCGESEYCWISYEPENEAARNLYLSFGFEEKPEDYVEGEEMPAVMKL